MTPGCYLTTKELAAICGVPVGMIRALTRRGVIHLAKEDGQPVSGRNRYPITALSEYGAYFLKKRPSGND
jgi:hypothetical protein